MANATSTPAAPAPRLNTGPVSIFFMVWGVTWTVLLVLGMAFLYYNRAMPLVRVRGLRLTFAAVILLHLYWILCQFGLLIFEYVPPEIMFWVMGMYVPWGIALFHASNSRFLYVAEAQKRFVGKAPAARQKPSASKNKTLLGKFWRLEYERRIVVVVCVGMALQFLLLVTMYLLSRKYHPSFGIPGTEVTTTNPMERLMQLYSGWEWWPSILWQFFWAWLVAPYILFKSRGIKDTLGWRVQTIACCIAGLPATPLWLAALYLPAFGPVNQYFIPPQWICVSITFIEFFAIILPCWQVLTHKTLRRETLDAIANWESRRGGDKDGKQSFASESTRQESTTSTWRLLSEIEKATGQSESLFTMAALDYMLKRNPEPLREFSALRDFSGENIAFLSAVSDWKAGAAEPKAPTDKTPAHSEEGVELRRVRFNDALHIYAEFVSPRHAEFQVNIGSADQKQLEVVFGPAAQILLGDSQRFDDLAVPFEMESTGEGVERVRAQYFGEIPDEFSDQVFDDAEVSIKYLVLTNTWPKFVKQGRYSMSINSVVSQSSDGSAEKEIGRVKKYLKRMKFGGAAL
ncbi:hypothetical protein MCOR27_001775 [Pyricularia oryzae]|uniref:RGS domain-containing protein n=2 Tax=Pyricularia TaxID=48558 RepID=A0ABQ8NFW0_PYRGI|nr:hypothetical protein MCOR01_008124 [Pyricularia oryzae]KAI6295448.1 hypothetical protein MCOR33_007660 [Pyricularia grisea]KAH9433194.1 hypothetical protein MCOR02_005250 [Pyricularia oryzae]KAI6256760.1 hypothetical protein MCOR19_006763 [Pyricularia oryzae]KAI6265030.1 hypothetical protein MCOR26_010974 [Pyricularia oryzae]